MASNLQNLQNGHPSRAPIKMTRKPQVKKQSVAILDHLQKMGLITQGIKKSDFKQIYDTNFRSMNQRTISSFMVMQYLLRYKYLRRINRSTPEIMNFYVEKVNVLLISDLGESVLRLTLQPGISQPATSVTTNAINRNQKPRRSAPPVIVSQREAFRLYEKLVNMSTLDGNLNYPSCAPCNKKFLDEELKEIHEKTDEHIFLAKYQVSRSHNKGNEDPTVLLGAAQGILITSMEGNEDRYTLQVNLTKKDDATIKNSFPLKISYADPKNNHLLFLDYMFLVFGDSNNCIIDMNTYSFRQEIPKENPLIRMITVLGNEVGRSEFVVVFKFVWETEEQQFSESFFVMKRISVRVDTEITKEEGIPVFSRAKVEFVHDDEDKAGLGSDFIVIGSPSVVETADPPPKPARKLKYVTELKQYEFPELYRSFFNCGFQGNGKITVDMLLKKYEVLCKLVEGLQEKNHADFFATLLYFEEHQTLYDLRSYSLKDTPIVRSNLKRNLIAIKVPGLAEKRPSVLKGDPIFVTVPKIGLFKGWVHQVGNSEVHVGLGPKFMNNFVDKMKVTVDFSFNRFCLQIEHRALELTKSGKRLPQICYPTTYGKYKKNKPVSYRETWFNAQVKANPEQAQAVQNIINGTSLPAPYLVFGPPGTGKTVTLVEAIKQIFFNSEADRVLGTAPSNNAADLLAERVLESVPVSQVLRLYSPSRGWSSVPEKLKKPSNFFNEECIFPSLEELKKYRVIICTLICAGRLVSGGFPVGHFTHVFIDESGHGMEPTSLVPIAGLLSPEPNPGQLVLSGDCHQLGPIIRSPVAKELGLDQSLLGRLMSLDLYKKQDDGSYNSQLLTKLVRNFRSHPDILKVPNELFYEGDLQACGNQGVTFSACQWDELPTKGVPLIFHGVEGKDEQDEASPSFFNIAEVNLVVNYVHKILDAKFCGQKLRTSDIGIISPYRRQILKLHRALERSKISGVDIGSVEEFQGQERRVIILSTVRSNPSKLALDRTFRLGFIREPKRFNVAITRAKALLIVIGNPNILQLDPNWRRLLEWTIEKGGYTGCQFKLSSEDDVLPATDPDQFRVPVQIKLEKQLELVKEALQLKQNSETYDSQIIEIMQQSGLFSVAQVSELQSDVSPPFIAHEQ